MDGGGVLSRGPLSTAIGRLRDWRGCDGVMVGARLPYFVHKPCSWREIIYPTYSIDLVQCMCRATTASPTQTVTREASKERDREADT